MLRVERRDAILLVTLERREKRNALHPDLIRSLSETLDRATADPSLAVVVLTGAGSSFCAGLDLDILLGLETEDRVLYMRSFFSLFRQVHGLPQPVIAAINGPAMAGGFDLAAACDVRLCAPEARFAQTEIHLGITPMLYPIHTVIGLGRAMELALTGEAIGAEEALRIGLVRSIHPRDQLLEHAIEFAGVLAARPRQALLHTRQLSRELIGMSGSAAIEKTFEAITERLRSEEHRAAAASHVARLRSSAE